VNVAPWAYATKGVASEFSWALAGHREGSPVVITLRRSDNFVWPGMGCRSSGRRCDEGVGSLSAKRAQWLRWVETSPGRRAARLVQRLWPTSSSTNGESHDGRYPRRRLVGAALLR